jgi:peroxin-6
MNCRHSAQPPFRYKLDMVGPALQGYAQEGETKFIFISASSSNVDSSPSHSSQYSVGDDSESGLEGIEIDEHFLASSVWPAIRRLPTSHCDYPLTNDHALDNGISEQDPSTVLKATFRMSTLIEPVSSINDDCTLYVRTADLGRIGSLNGDWVSFVCLKRV